MSDTTMDRRMQTLLTVVTLAASVLVNLGCDGTSSRVTDESAALAEYDQGGGAVDPCPSGIYDEDGFCVEPSDDDPDPDPDPDPEDPPVVLQNLGSVTKIAAGANHACAISGGTVFCWGGNSHGQLGPAAPPEGGQAASPVPSLVGVTSVAAGQSHSCAVSGGVVYCWGDNTYGQLGTGVPGGTSTPAPTLNITTATSVSAGSYHSCALLSNQRVVCWGRNNQGQLGLGLTSATAATPSSSLRFQTANGTIFSIVEVQAKGNVTCVRATNSVYCAGSNAYGQLGVDPPGLMSSNKAVKVGNSGAYQNYYTALAITGETGCAIKNGLEVVCWGRNNQSLLLGATNEPYAVTPVAVLGEDAVVTGIYAGSNRICGKLGGTLRCWGVHQSAETPSYVESTPVAVAGLSAQPTEAALGDAFGCAPVSGGAQCWGSNGYGQLGNPTVTPASVSAVQVKKY
ncbi:MAG: hypothetical protein IT285_12495 [Bdellovibrionales bacterium]|nr:hypothetical protein [Bdellovibrionales bacterium]